ncbi:MAG: fused MFS/spermidine synthase [Candidatus Delongbacteria bacterium]|nr:fused MFS/spermidine synthase [Candidatus Delongbacteria bacterium]MCG2760106.1 fused MFS/spermidine synthase [Candidatus Delongbacteria bacterium]
MRSKQAHIFIALGVILFFSGSFSLIYQVAWVRFLTLLLGSTTMGITTVVASFMGGLAIGSWLASRYLISKEKPLKVYALLEFLIAITAFISPFIFKWAFSILPVILQKIGDANLSILILRILFSAIIMLIPTICMGAALPVLGKYLQKYSKLAERRITIIYGLNTIGACAGCIASGYFLLRGIGLINTIYITAAANALLPVAILLLPQLAPQEANSKSLKAFREQKYLKGTFDAESSLRHGARNVILVIAALVGFIGLTSELVWTRLIVLTVGGSIYAYSTILAVYLFFYGTGAALGGASLKFIALRAGNRTFDVSRTVFFTLLMLIPVATTASIAVANFLPDFYISNFSVERSSTAYGLFVNQLLPAIILMSPATLLSGIFFSYGLFMMKQCTDNPAANTSFFYSWNTVGGIAGTIAAAFLLIPYFGLDYSLRFTSTLLIAAGLLSAFLMKIKKIVRIQIIGLVCLLIIWLIVPGIDKVAITAGAGIYTPMFQQDLQIEHGVGKIIRQAQDMIYYRDGFTATVTVAHYKQTNTLDIKTNGKPDGSSYFDMPTQKLSAHFPALFHPKPENACVIGFGTGTTVGSLALHPGIKVDAIEIEPAIIEGAMLLNDYNNKPLECKNVDLHITDGRLHLQTSIGKYDLIISEPSNPWLAGVSDLFTVEFYKLANEALTPDGVFGQWIQMYSLKTEALQIVLRSFQEVFPETYMIVVTPGIDLLLVGVKGSYKPELEDIKKRISLPVIAADISHPAVNVNSAYELFSRLVFGPENTRRFAGKGPVNTDILPILSYMAPLSLFDYQVNSLNMQKIAGHSMPIINILGWNLPEPEEKKVREAQEEFFRQHFFIR